MKKRVNVISRAVEQSKLIRDCTHKFYNRPAHILGRDIKPQYIGEDYYLPCHLCGVLKRETEVSIPIESGDDLPHRIDREISPEVIQVNGGNMRTVYKGMIIKTASETGGKAGKGKNKTSTIRVVDPGGEAPYTIKKEIRFIVGDGESLKSAWKKAKDFIDGKPAKRGGARPGAGIRKEPLEGGDFTVTYLDDPTRETMEKLGKGNRSKGIRDAAKIIGKLPQALIDKMLEEEK